MVIYNNMMKTPFTGRPAFFAQPAAYVIDQLEAVQKPTDEALYISRAVQKMIVY